MKEFKSNVINVVFGTSIIQLSTIANFIILARILSVDEFGMLRQLLLISQMIFAVIFAAIPVSALYYCSLQKENKCKKHVIVSHTKVCLSIGLLSSILIFLFKDTIALAFGGEYLSYYLISFSIYPLFHILYNFVPTALIALEEVRLIKWYCPIIAVINTVVVAVTALIYDFESVVYAYIISAALSFFIALAVIYFVTKGHSVARDNVGIVSYSKIIKYSWFLALASGIGIIASRYDHMLVSNELGASIFAIYAVGAFQLPIFSVIQTSVNSVIFSKMVQYHNNGDWEAFSQLWKSALNKIAMVCLPISALLVVFSEEFITILFGEVYVEAVWIFVAFSLLAPIRCVSFGYIFKVIGKTHLDVIGAIVLLVLTVVLVTLGLNYYGELGAALGVVLSTYILSFFMMLIIKRQTNNNMKFSSILPMNLFVKFIGFTLIFTSLKFSFVWIFS
ncbi:oligosaccharide flippase family protein [Shewanella sp. SP1S1-7]|uniref:oligosaccharide flippase family protein n=1 Tax=Shewanella sp. SP1S1-7 TaxID=3063536 RepID=UPI00288FFD06|nr:oligosaccharide flippase family protein [Shewanella sp. SP1S1-7]MDT3336844.1 oligosaccharide flippase family protein [Shewanella sp. SP1S1-7]